MWIGLFVIVIAVSIFLCFAAVLLRDLESRTQPFIFAVQLDEPTSSTFAKAVGRMRNMSAMMDRLWVQRRSARPTGFER